MDTSEQLSKYFTLKDLTKTDAPLVVPNTFDDPSHYNNLKSLALLLDEIWDKIGPFDIISGYRSKAVQAWLKTETTQAATASFHSLGLAVDIMPTTMSAGEFFARILANNELRNKLGEIAVKNTVLHISSAVPPNKVNVPMVVENNVYRRISSEEQNEFLKKYNLLPVAGGLAAAMIIAGGIIAYLYLKKKKAT